MNDKLNLLYVDDEPLNCCIFETIFSQWFEVAVALNGKQALERLSSNPNISIIVSDMNMPGMNGLEFIEAAKHINPDIPCFILSGYEQSIEAEKAIQDGTILRYFRKPLNYEEILAGIEQDAAIELQSKVTK